MIKSFDKCEARIYNGVWKTRLFFISQAKSGVKRDFSDFNGLQKELRNARKCSGMLVNAPIAKTKPFGENDMQNMMGRIRRCAEDYNMIAEGDKIAVGVSGARIR